MTAKPPSLPRPPSRRVFRFLLKAFAAILVVLLVWHVSFRIRTHREIKRLEAKARANGEPWTLAELAATYYAPIPDEENAAIPLMDLWQEEDPGFWVAFREGHERRPARREKSYPDGLPVFDKAWKSGAGSNRTSAAELKLMEEFLTEKAEHLQKLHAASKLPKARFPTKIEEGFAALLPQLPALKEESQLLRLEGLHWIANNDVERAVAALETNLRLAALLTEDTTLIGQLVRQACLRIGTESLSDLIESGLLDEGQTTKLFFQFHDAAHPEGMRRSIVAERAMVMELFNDPVEAFRMADDTPREGALIDGSALAGRLVQLTGVALADKAFYAAKMDFWLSSYDLPEHQSLEAIEGGFADLGNEILKFPPKVISGMLLPALAKARNRQAQSDAVLRCAQTAVQIERFRFRNEGRLPGNLDQLVPEFLEAVPLDPFDGQPLRYQRLDVGYVVYSVGQDRVNDGGRKKQPMSGRGYEDKELTYDEAFTVGR